jgi:hypothetical protein
VSADTTDLHADSQKSVTAYISSRQFTGHVHVFERAARPGFRPRGVTGHLGR